MATTRLERASVGEAASGERAAGREGSGSVGLLAVERRRRSGWRSALHAFAQDKAAVAAAVVLLLIVVAAVLAPWIAPFDPTEADPTLRNKPIGTEGHLLGLDYQGRDMLSRLMYGGRVSLPSAILPVLAASALGLALGILAAYAGGIVETLVTRLTDVFFALPDIILAIALAAALGRGLDSVIIATTLVIVAPLTRMAYVAAREQRSAEYVTAARAVGAPVGAIVGRHLLPNVLPSILVYASTIVGLLIVFTSTLSFLGLGVAPPTSDWGLMVDEGRRVMSIAWHVSTLPGVVIGVAALCCNLVGDGLRYALDPRQHRH